MSHPTYRLQRVFWFIWRWDVRYPARGRACGYSITKRTARWAARCEIRGARLVAISEASPAAGKSDEPARRDREMV